MLDDHTSGVPSFTLVSNKIRFLMHCDGHVNPIFFSLSTSHQILVILNAANSSPDLSKSAPLFTDAVNKKTATSTVITRLVDIPVD
ncbi:hypothetical protein NPIL_24431 [Nephila pilipes]|uniref:Uncharacterized protein n=1 Tax=Nephila pilipes TaxID=299642 RepID=A0A8X6R0S9_NEPPI|nr:hypothetical protein NPIL_24431 [Nephila pilipes]